MKKIITIAILSFGIIVSQTMAQSISRQVVATAGGTLSNGNSQLNFSIGETVIASLSVGGVLLTQGFEQPGEHLKTGITPLLLCAGSTILVPFVARDIGGNNTFTAQLSNAAGSFAAPSNMGTSTGNVSGTIAATVPANTPAGAGYRIRVVSSSPPVVAMDNGTNITVISPTPVAKCKNAIVTLSSAGNGSITGAGINNGSTDQCIDFGLTFSLSKSSFNCSDVGQNIVTLTVTNISGNSSTCTAKVTVKDLTKPIAKCKNLLIPIVPGSTVVVGAAQVSNGSSDACSVPPFLSLTPNTFTCSNSGPNVVTLTVSDVNGNVNSCQSVVTINCNNSNIKLEEPTPLEDLAVGFDFFPNPATEKIQLKLFGDQEFEKLVVISDYTGKQLWSQTVEATSQHLTIDLQAAGIRSGLYLLSIKSLGRMQSKQLVVFRD